MEEKDEKVGSDPEIEAHRRKISQRVNEEPRDEQTEGESGDDDFEAHRHVRKS